MYILIKIYRVLKSSNINKLSKTITFFSTIKKSKCKYFNEFLPSCTSLVTVYISCQQRQK